jgi:hypothetical protein
MPIDPSVVMQRFAWSRCFSLVQEPLDSTILGEPETESGSPFLISHLANYLQKSPCKIAPALGYLGRKKPVDRLDSEGRAGYGNGKMFLAAAPQPFVVRSSLP